MSALRPDGPDLQTRRIATAFAFAVLGIIAGLLVTGTLDQVGIL